MHGCRMYPVLAILLIIVFSGCTNELSPHGRELLQNASDAYARGDDKTVIGHTDSFISQYGKAAEVGEAYYLRGLSRYRMKDLAGAQSDLNQAASLSGGRQLRGKAYAALGDLAYEQEDMALAEHMYRNSINLLQEGPKSGGVKPLDQALYRLGCVLQRQGRWAEADAQFDRLIYLFESSDFAKRASRKVRCTAWTIQAGAYKDRARAQAAVRQLKNDGFAPAEQLVKVDETVRFVVNIGRFPTYEQAKAELQNVQQHRRDAFIETTR